jgi:hypothetical protein
MAPPMTARFLAPAAASASTSTCVSVVAWLGAGDDAGVCEVDCEVVLALVCVVEVEEGAGVLGVGVLPIVVMTSGLPAL